MRLYPVRFLVVAFFACAAMAQATEPPIIAKARAYVGSEEALNGIRSIHYTGTLVVTDSADPKTERRASIEILLQKPDQQRVTITSPTQIESTALNDYEAWTRTTLAKDPTKWQQTLLGVDGVKRLRANTWENLAFFRGLEADGGTVEDKGPAMIDGVSCEKVAFVHAPNIVFTRYFDRSNGRVLLSETETGSSIKEHGEIHVDGIRLPKQIVTIAKTQNGATQTITVTFDKVVLNERMPESLFAVPSLINR